jgi:hypothetical protein
MDVSLDTTASADEVWSVLANGWTFGSWVVGAARIRAVDEHWPDVGAKLFHSVGTWPALLDDSTSVLESRANRELHLLARALPFGRATIALRITEQPRGCRISMSERAASGPMTHIPDAVQSAAVRARNRECLRRLALLAEKATKP